MGPSELEPLPLRRRDDVERPHLCLPVGGFYTGGAPGGNHRSAIDGLQWSLNLSVGVSYRLYRDWSLYLEPRYSYYFDNRQPVSYRTENMTLIGVGAGVRFEF